MVSVVQAELAEAVSATTRKLSEKGPHLPSCLVSLFVAFAFTTVRCGRQRTVTTPWRYASSPIAFSHPPPQGSPIGLPQYGQKVCFVVFSLHVGFWCPLSCCTLDSVTGSRWVLRWRPSNSLLLLNFLLDYLFLDGRPLFFQACKGR